MVQVSTQKQLLDVEDMTTKDWDFVCIQAYGIKTLTDPVKRLIDRGIPVIDMDTRIVPEGEDIGLWTFVTPDHFKQGEQATEAVVAAMGYKGVQIPTWDARLIDLERAATSKDYCDEIAGICADAGVEISELSTHLQGQLVRL